jgi:hypothetical protein
VVDRIQNVIEVFDADTHERTTYDLTSLSGRRRMKGKPGACAAFSLTDTNSPLLFNDPAPDLLEATPDGKFLMTALRGPAPVSVAHSSQGVLSWRWCCEADTKWKIWQIGHSPSYYQ